MTKKQNREPIALFSSKIKYKVSYTMIGYTQYAEPQTPNRKSLWGKECG